MTLDIVDIGDHHTSYPPASSAKFEDSPQDYIDLAKRVIGYFAPRFYPSLKKEMLSNEDVVSNMATAIMKADWRWNENYRSKTGKVRTRKAYRNQCGLWEITAYLKRKKRKRDGMQVVSLNYFTSSNDEEQPQLIDVLPDEVANPAFTVADAEEQAHRQINIEGLLTAGILTKKEEKYIRMYYLQEVSLSDIGRMEGVSREAIRQDVARGIGKLQKLAKAL